MKTEEKKGNSFKFIVMFLLVLVAGYLYLNQSSGLSNFSFFLNKEGQVLGPSVPQSYNTTIRTDNNPNYRNDYASITTGSCVDGKYIITFTLKDSSIVTQEASC